MNRVSLLNYLVRRNQYRSYLEIGCASNRTFRRVSAPHRVGVDPERGGTLRMTSDEFFHVNREKFDLVFIDGLHLAEQVISDVDNALKALNPQGCIVIHDCLPRRFEHQLRNPTSGVRGWTGDVWKAVVSLRQRPDCDTAVLETDWGLGVVLPRPNSDVLQPQGTLTWQDFQQQASRLLRVVNAEELKHFVRSPRTSSSRAASTPFGSETPDPVS